jgi:hypothetical protein
VNSVKLLTVPAVLLLSGLMAVPAFGQTPSATISNLITSCNSDHKVCFDFDVTTTDFAASGRDISVDLIDANTGTVLETLTEHLTADTTHVHDCFTTNVATTTTLTIKIRAPAGSDLDLSGTLTADTHGCVTSTTTTTTTTTTTSTTTTLPPLDHFQCYEVKPKAFTVIPGVSVQDQFGNHTETVRFPHRLCAPADKRDEFPDAPTHPEHLIGHLVSGPSVKVPNQILVNQFGTIKLDVVKPDILMVPTLKTLAPPGPPALAQPTVDHFQCYKVTRSKGAPKFQKILGVKVDDQFGTAQLDLLTPARLCAPANKRNEDPTAPDHPEHLLCYKTKDSGFGMVRTFTNSQFGPAHPLLIHRRELCVPTLKNPGTTTTTSTTSTTTSSTTTSTTTTSTTTSTTTTTPPITFQCPPLDLAGRPLLAHSTSATEIFCRFQSVPNDFFCKYFSSTGLLLQDHDDGFCPPVAVPSV